MYYINIEKPIWEQIKFKNSKKVAEEIGIDRSTLSRILNGKQGTRKITAHCITKAYNPNAEIEDYFILKGE